MKKIFSLILAVVICLSLCACEKNNTDNSPKTTTTETTESNVIEIGKEHITKNFTFTVNEIGFSESICIEKGDKIGLPSETGDAIKASEGYGWLYYSVSYKFTGSEKMDAVTQFASSIKYGDTYFSTPNLRFFKYDGAWHGLAYYWGNGTSIGLNLPATDSYHQHDPFVEKYYELHGAVQVANKAVEDKETELILQLFLDQGNEKQDKYSLTVNIEPPKEKSPEERLLTFSYEDREFFKEYVADRTPMTEDAILSVIKGNTFEMKNNYLGNHTITFNDDGSVDAKYTYEGKEYVMYDTWAIKDGYVVLTHSFTDTYGNPKTSEYKLTPYQYDTSRYLLMHMDMGDYSMVITAK